MTVFRLCAVPGKPTMMISTMMGNMALIQWQPPKEMVGELVGFQLQYRRADEDAFSVKDFRKTDDHFAVTGLHKGATYTFKLSAKNQAGVGEEHVKEISTPEDVPSSYPQNLSVVGLGSTSTRLAWEPPPPAERNGRIVRYMIVYRDINSPHNSSNSTPETQMTLQGLQPETTYDIRVQAFTSKGGGPISPSIQIRTTPTSMPGKNLIQCTSLSYWGSFTLFSANLAALLHHLMQSCLTLTSVMQGGVAVSKLQVQTTILLF